MVNPKLVRPKLWNGQSVPSAGGKRFIKRKQIDQQAAKIFEVEGVRTVGLGVLGIVMHFHKNSIYTRGHSGAGQNRDEFWLPSTGGNPILPGGGRQLHRVGGVKNNGRKTAHYGQRAHVYH